MIVLQGSFSPVNGQTMLKGRVIDKLTREPLELAVVANTNTLKKTLTDKEGKIRPQPVSIPPTRSTDLFHRVCVRQVNGDRDHSTNGTVVELEKGPVDLKEVIITSHSNNLTTSRILSSIDLNLQPVRSAQDLLRLIPGHDVHRRNR